mgnify:CR=1 FL=1|jgi:hypothetical protein
MAKPKGGLTKWFKKEKWVDIASPKKKGKYQPCGRKSAKSSKRGYPKCVPLATAKKQTSLVIFYGVRLVSGIVICPKALKIYLNLSRIRLI